MGSLPSRNDSDEDRRLEEATRWIARIRDRDIDASDPLYDEFSSWIEADPANEAAYQEMLGFWDMTAQPARHVDALQAGSIARTEKQRHERADRVPENRGVPGRRRTERHGRARAIYATAASLLIFAAIAVANKQKILDHIATDFSTETEMSAPIRLVDGSSVILNAGSAIDVDMTDSYRQVRLLKGEVWFDVASNPAVPFKVTARHGSVSVTGTKFNLSQAEDGYATVSLMEGAIRVSGPKDQDGNSAVLKPGQQITMSSIGLSPPKPFDTTAVTAWQREQLVFYDAPLSTVIDALNRHRDGRIVLINDRYRSHTISGVFSTRDTDAALSAIAEMLPIKAIRLTDYLILLR